MNKLTEKIATIGLPLAFIVIPALALGYMVSVGIVWGVQELVNLTFSTSYSVNVWAGGGLFYVLLLLFKK